MRLFFDISTVARRSGPPGGIGRVESELASYAFTHRPDICFTFYDHSIGAFREAKREWIPDLIGTEAALDTSRLLSPRRRLISRFPPLLRSVAFWVRRFPRNLQVVFERLRLTAKHPAVRRTADRLANWVRSVSARLGKKKPRPRLLPFDVVIGDPVPLGSDCVLVSVGNDWSFKQIGRIAELRERHGFRYVILCHDLIMIQFPELPGELAAQQVRDYWNIAFPLADLVICTTYTVESDVRDYCRAHDLALRETAIVRLGWNPGAFASVPTGDLPEGLDSGKFILFVSALEARKGHEMIMSVWKRLLGEGIPQAHRFKLVFVGGYMFNTPQLKERLQNGEGGDSLIHFSNLSDAGLALLYRHAAFCIYPSRYEGFGLPVVEAFGAGKPIIVSTGGSVPEVAAGLAPCIDPTDADAWFAEMKMWIEKPEIREEFAKKIRDGFAMPTWTESAERFFDRVQQPNAERRVPLGTRPPAIPMRGSEDANDDSRGRYSA